MQTDIKNLALLNPSDTMGLLAYYRDKMTYFENERLEFISEIEKLKVSQKEKHELEWENYRLKSRNEDLEKTLRELKVKCMEERTFIVQLKGERDRLTEELDKERGQLNQVLKQNRPVEQKISFKEGKKPKFHHKYIKKNDLRERADRQVKTSSKNYTVKTELECNSKPKQEGIGLISTKAMEKLIAENEALIKQVTELQDENSALEAKIKEKTVADNERYKSLLEKNQKIERINIELNKEFFKQRGESNNKQSQLSEEIELLKVKLLNLTSKLQEQEKENESETMYKIRLAENKTQSALENYKQQVKDKERSINIIRKQYEMVQQIFKEKLETLSKENSKLRSLYQKNDKAQKLMIEGAQTENINLRERLNDMEHELYYEQEVEQPIRNTQKRKGGAHTKTEDALVNLKKTIAELTKRI